MQSHYCTTEPQLLHDLRSLADQPPDHLHYSRLFLMAEILSRVFEGFEIGRRPVIHGGVSSVARPREDCLETAGAPLGQRHLGGLSSTLSRLDSE
jgi:hypothetical protein